MKTTLSIGRAAAVLAAVLALACSKEKEKEPAQPGLGAFRVEPQGTFQAGASVGVRVTALDTTGAVMTSYRGTVHFSSDDASAVLPADTAFTEGDAGAKLVQAVLKAAGAHQIVVNDTVLTASRGLASVSVAPGPATALHLGGVATSAAAGAPVSFDVTAVDAFGNTATAYARTVTVTASDAAASLPPPHAFTPADAGHAALAVSFATAGNATIHVADDSSPPLQATSATVAVGPGDAFVLRVLGVPGTASVDDVVPFTLRFEDRFGNRATGYTGTVHVSSSDVAAPAPADVVFGPTEAGEASGSLTFFTSGLQTLVFDDGVRQGSAEVAVAPGTAAGYALSGLPTLAAAGDPLPLAVTALDLHGNVATGYPNLIHVSSADPTDQLPADGGATEGVRRVAVAFRSAGLHQVTATEVSGSLTATSSVVSVSAQAASSIELAAASGSATAGASFALTATARDLFGNRVGTYAGTIHFSSDDAAAVLPADTTFTGGDAGQHAFAVTLKTAGTRRISATDTVASAVGGSAALAVSHAAPSQCAVSGVPANATAGTQLAARVRVSDAFGNAASGYAGTVSWTSSDARATLTPPSAAFDPATDAGTRAFAARLLTTGPQTLSAADGTAGFACQASLVVDPASQHLVVTVPSNPMAGVAQAATISAVDAFDNPVPSGDVVTLSSTDAAAILPATVTLVAGTASTSFTFRTVGTATVNAAAASGPSGAAVVNVHGLVYTDPALGLGKVRLVRNAASFGDVLQLDLVSNTRLITAGAVATRRNGAYSVAMNLPVGAGLVVLDPTTPLVEGNVLALGSPPKAVGAVLPAAGPGANLLISGASQKMTGTGAVTGDATLSLGQTFYSLVLRIAPGATLGAVFDGNALPTSFKASVRDRSGVDTIRLEDFALGKLEIR